MKRSSSNKIILTFMFVIPVIIVITIFLIAFKPWDKYSFNGPLAYPQDQVVKVKSPTIGAKEGIVLGGLHFRNKTDENIQIISVRPSNISSDMKFKVLGITDQNIKSLKDSEFTAEKDKYNLKKLPFKVPAGNSDYQPVVELIPQTQGNYAIDGLIVTYKYKDKMYREFYPDQFTVIATE